MLVQGFVMGESYVYEKCYERLHIYKMLWGLIRRVRKISLGVCLCTCNFSSPSISRHQNTPNKGQMILEVTWLLGVVLMCKWNLKK